MENEMDLTLKLGLPNPTVDTHLSLKNLTSYQGTNVVNGGRRDNNDETVRNNIRRAIRGDDEVIIDDDEGARNNLNINIRVYNIAPNTSKSASYPMPPSPPPALVTPPTIAHRNNSLALTNAWDANAQTRWHRGCGGNRGGRNEGTRKCTNMNCNALTTPMWRRGPLGPKSLCNACGIKFRKEEERRSKRN